MKKTISLILSVVLILLCLSSCQVLDLLRGEEENPPTLPEEMPENFSFILRWHKSGLSSYDSSSGELNKIGCDESAVYIMPQEDLKKVYKLIYNLDILSYEDELDQSKYVSAPPPGNDYYFTVKANDITKSVIALNASPTSSTTSQKYWKYFYTVRTIIKMLQATDEWESLVPKYISPG